MDPQALRAAKELEATLGRLVQREQEEVLELLDKMGRMGLLENKVQKGRREFREAEERRETPEIRDSLGKKVFRDQLEWLEIPGRLEVWDQLELR